MPAREPVARRPVTPPARQGSGRVPWGTISREQVIEAALRVVESGGYPGMTMRSLAAELGARPMSLYRHVRDKDDLLDEVVDRLLARVWRPRGRAAGDWKGWTIDVADRLRQLLVTQPAALHVYLRHPVLSPAAVERMEAMMEVLGRVLGGEAMARPAYAAVQTYTVGFAALQASRAAWTPPEGWSDRLARSLVPPTTPRQFADGLRYLLDGAEADSRPPDAGTPKAPRRRS